MAKYNAPTFDVNLDPEGFVIDLNSLYAALTQLHDKRDPRGVRYSLVTIVVFVLLAKLAGENFVSGIADWVAYRIEPLSELLHLEHRRAPHGSTMGRILAFAIDDAELEKVVHDFFMQAPAAGASIEINIDGKKLRGTIPAGKTQGVHEFAAFLPGEGWVALQIEVSPGENEIRAAPRLLKALDLRGKIVTGDAMLAQRDLSKLIVAAGGEYVWTVKTNQSDLYDDIQTLFAPEQVVPGFSAPKKDFRTAKTVDKGHGRLEVRTLTASAELKTYLGWPYAEQVFRLERTFTRLSDGKVMHDVSFGITSLKASEANAARVLALVRGHWRIENQLHYRRDATLREDWCQVRRGRAPQVLATLNNLVLGLLLRRKVVNVPAARRKYAADFSTALNLITTSQF
ncbi:MAG: ISAs1 family transposase [Chloroflexi bacterium]|nr:MAG: ISAs1 family transposase [Chloroflexota bacterium]